MDPLDDILQKFLAEARKRVWGAPEPPSPLFPGLFTLVRELVLAKAPLRVPIDEDVDRAESYVTTLRKSRYGGVVELPPCRGSRGALDAQEWLEHDFVPAMRTGPGAHFVAFRLGCRVVCVLDEACYYPPERFLQDAINC